KLHKPYHESDHVLNFAYNGTSTGIARGFDTRHASSPAGGYFRFPSFSSAVSFRGIVSFEERASSRPSPSSFPSLFSDSDDAQQG
ncbi:MAG: hypothetical protein WCK89_23555, partial [bacterium]